MTIFQENAPKHWAKGLPVIPIKAGEKRPAIASWQHYADRMPTPEEQAEWLQTYANGNLGLPLGPCSNLTAVDIDSDIEEVIGAIEGVLPQTPWRRVGKKGAVLIFRYRDHKTVRIRDENEKSICEILSRGTQIVIPPSIHPDTKKPYWANTNLIEILDQIPYLPPDADIIVRGVLADLGIKVTRQAKVGVTTFVPAGMRDNALVSNAGLYAMAVSRGERTLKEALAQMQEWVENFTQKVIGDEMSVEKAQQKVVEFLIRDVIGEKKKVLPIGWDEGLTEEDKKRLGLTITEENEAWDYDRASARLNKLMEETKDFNSRAFLNALDSALTCIAASKDISPMSIDVLLKSINKGSKKACSMKSLRQRFDILNGPQIDGNDHTEIAEAILNDLSKHAEVRGEADSLWRWDGACWSKIEEDEIFKLLMREYGNLPAAKKAGDHLGIRKVLQRLAHKALRSVKERGLNFANGYLTTDLVLRKHDPDYGATYTLPYRYVPERWDRASMWTTFLYDIWGKDEDYEEKVMCLQEAMAATLFGIAPKLQRVFCLMGVSATGKSTVRLTMEKLLPPRVRSAINPSDWSDKFLPARMHGKLLNIAGELSNRKRIAGARFKEIVTAETITGQSKHGQPFEFQATCAHWFSSNNMPESDDTDDGFSRRWLFLNFYHRVPKEKRITDYEDIILAGEGEEIMAWAVQAMPRLLERGYTIPASSARQEAQLLEKLNSVHHFLKSSSTILVGRAGHEGRPKTKSTFDDVFSEYERFCLNKLRVKPESATRFREMINMLQTDHDFQVVPDESRRSPMPDFHYLTVL